jgi:hypothetical protein
VEQLVQPGMSLRFVYRPGFAALAIGSLGTALALSRLLASSELAHQPRAELVNVPRAPQTALDFSLDTLLGRSGELRTRLLLPQEALGLVALRRAASASSGPMPPLRVSLSHDGSEFYFLTLKPWSEKRGGYVGRYYVGWWPSEGSTPPYNYRNPVGFVEVNREAAEWRISRHFRLKDFLTRDQPDVWPKYLVLREELLDKLELVLASLEAQGIPTSKVVVLSGFRTPQYNRAISYEGAAYASRHMYGDAADLIVDADGDGRMDDLNGDGVVDFHDTDVINRAVERVERRYPELVGGLGLYHAMGPSGPFAHIDVRGSRARWTGGLARSGSTPSPATARVEPVGRCRAAGEFALLCRSTQ